MRVPFLIKQTNNSKYPFIIEPLDCQNCKGETFPYIFNSAVVTIVIGVFIFAIALGWNNVAQEIFESAKDEEQMVASKLNYAFLITVIGILVSATIMYYVNGEKW